MLFAALVLGCIDFIRRNEWPGIPRVAWAGFVFVAVMALVTVLGPFSERGIPKLRKLLWFAGIPVAANLVRGPKQITGVLSAFAAGTGVLCLERCFLRPYQAFMAVQSGEAPGFLGELIRIGSMTDGQMLMLGIIASFGIISAARSEGRNIYGWTVLLVLQFAGLVMNFKRGSWFVCGIIVVIFLSMKRKWGWLVMVAALAAATCILPPVRARLMDLRGEIGPEGGERWAMWTRVAPSLMEKYPWGVGYRTLTNKMNVRRAPGFIAPHRDHLHSNVVQVLVAGGWAGLLAYLFWMWRAFSEGFTFVRRTAEKDESESTGSAVLLLMLTALFLNGFVEYNLGDAELALVYGIVIGCIAAGCRQTKEPAGMEFGGLHRVLE